MTKWRRLEVQFDCGKRRWRPAYGGLVGGRRSPANAFERARLEARVNSSQKGPRREASPKRLTGHTTRSATPIKACLRAGEPYSRSSASEHARPTIALS